MPAVHSGGQSWAPLLDKVHSGLSYSAVGSEFNVNGSVIHTEQGFFKQKHTRSKVRDLLVDENVTRSLQEPNAAFPLEAMAQYL